jgi:YVTN family beta-propeller protein
VIINGSDNSVSNIPINSYNVAVNPVTNTIYVTQNRTIAVINGTTRSEISSISMDNPGSIGVNPITNKIYVASYTDNTVSVIDGSTNKIMETLTVGANPSHVAVNPITNKVYVTNQGSNSVSVIDGNSPRLGIYPYWESCCYGQLGVNGRVDNTINGINQLQLSIFAPNGTLVFNQTESAEGFQANYLMHRSDGAGNYTIIGTYDKTSLQKTIPSFITGNATVFINNSFESLDDGTIYISGLATNAISEEKVSVSVSDPSNSIIESNVISINNHAQYLDILGPLSTAGNYTITATFLYNGNTAKESLAYVCVASNCVTPHIMIHTTTTITMLSNKTIPENPFTLTATVLPPTATGTIQFQIDGKDFESPVTLSEGTASFTTSLPTGTHDMTASYSGDRNFTPSLSAHVTITVYTPALATQGMIITVNNMTLSQGTTKSLDAKLDTTISYLNANDTYDAKSSLQSFISEVNAQTGKHIIQGQANQLVTAARNIINAIP